MSPPRGQGSGGGPRRARIAYFALFGVFKVAGYRRTRLHSPSKGKVDAASDAGGAALSTPQPGEQDRGVTLHDQAIAELIRLGLHPLEVVALELDDVDLDAGVVHHGSRTLSLDRDARDALLLWTRAGRFAFLNAHRDDLEWDGPMSNYRRHEYRKTGTRGRYELDAVPGLFILWDGKRTDAERAQGVAARWQLDIAPTPLRAVAS